MALGEISDSMGWDYAEWRGSKIRAENKYYNISIYYTDLIV